MHQNQYPNQQQPMQQNQQMPQFYMPDDQATAQAYQNSAQTTGGAAMPQFLRVPGPQGQTKWDGSVPVGYEGALIIRLCPPWAPGKPVFVEQKAHFCRVFTQKHPNGFGLPYAGDDSLFMQAVRIGMQSSDDNMRKLANECGKVKKKYLYNVFDLSNPTSHYGQDGVMRPYILDMGVNVQKELARVTEVRQGISRIVHPLEGRSLRYSKKKTGPRKEDVEYGIIDLDPQALNAYFYPGLEHLWDLEALLSPPSQEVVLNVIREAGLPMPATGQSFGQVPQNYNPNPSPPYPTPYQQPQQQMQTQGQWQAPPMTQTNMAPPIPVAMQQHMPMQQQMPMMPPPPPMGNPNMGAPPPMAPPPVSSNPGAPMPPMPQTMTATPPPPPPPSAGAMNTPPPPPVGNPPF